MLDVLKSLYMTGSGPLWRKASPFAAPSAILILLDHGRGMVPSNFLTKSAFSKYNNVKLHDHVKNTRLNKRLEKRK